MKKQFQYPLLGKMPPADVLRAVRNLLEPPSSWCQHNLAQDKDGQPVRYISPYAVRFSLEGALYRMQYITRSPIHVAYVTLKRLVHPREEITLASYNDKPTTTQQSVLILLNRGIVLLEKSE